MNDNEGVIKIRFISKEKGFALPDDLHEVPVNIDEKSLTENLNKLLKKSHVDYKKPLDFSFIIGGELLKTTLGEYLNKNSLSTESRLDIEYIHRKPPEFEDSILHEDWISGIHACAGKWILTGCYDQAVYIWNSDGKPIVSLENHSNIVKDVKWISKDDPQKGFVSVSYDFTAILWHWEEGTTNAKPTSILKGHSGGIDCVAVSPNTQKLVTGSRDTALKVWSASLEDEEEPASKKSRNEALVNVRNQIYTLEGHKEAISSVQWMDDCNIITSSMDHTVKVWDVDVNSIKNEIVGQKAILSASWSPLTNSLLTTSADQYIRLFDLRSNESASCKSSFISHTNWVSSVDWSPHSEHLFISGGYDSKVKIWDTRNPKASLYDLQGHDGQVLKVNWSNENHLFSGGTDNYVYINKYTV
ncbi:ribosome biogenesis protein WDR12 homolog [Coccinella septempunctata]|uniref:ribosome biogenesis protein WDR12 homolog n=1 Tax=Coccinella septempunctata TaxID=41139 RepID=UPI001D077985|nr:ribosome biogenesis protein WDR12 homolog [Coccinella septempunctata]